MDRSIRVAAAVFVLAWAVPGHALFDPGNVGLPDARPGIFDPGEPPVVPPPPPPPPPLHIPSVGVDWIQLSVRPPAGRTSQLWKQPPGGAYAPFGALAAGVETTIRDEGLRVGQRYCYRVEITGGGLPDETHTRCETTDWRVGFEALSLTKAEGAEVLRLFDWRDTHALAEGAPDAPALYYMNLLLEGGDPLAEQAFRYLGMHVQTTPLFPAELEGWNGAQAVAEACSVSPLVAARALGPVRPELIATSCAPVGRWVFAAVPGAVYNELRARMLEQIGRGEAPSVRALVFRRIPVAEAHAPGVSRHVLHYVYLGQQGFEFNAIPRCREIDGLRVCEVRQELLGWLARKAIKWVAELADSAIEGVRSAIGRVTRLVKGEVRLELELRLLNTDPAFGHDQVMRSGWSGRELKLAGVKVEVRQGLGAFYDHTDSEGRVTLTVAKNIATKVCIQVENSTAEITEYLLEATVCVKSLGELDGDRSEVVEVRHDYLNTLAAMTDAREYLHQVAGVTMPKITVLVGDQADGFAAAGRSFAPCMGRVPGVLGLGADLLGVLGSLVNPAFLLATAATEFFYSVDIVLRSENDGSRGVPVHEYAHTVMCEMMLRQGFDAFQIAWTDVIISTSSQSVDSEASYLNEAFADFLTAQVLGGANYFAPVGSSPSEDVNYCAAGALCLEENALQGSDFRGQVRRIATLLHDAFDGHGGADATPNDASHWNTGTPFAHQGGDDSDRGDETVALAGGDLEALFEHWDARGTLLREDNFLGGLADLAESRGYAEADVCALFALHDGAASCPSFVAARPWIDWSAGGGVQAEVLAAFTAAPAPALPGAEAGGAGRDLPALLLAIASGASDPAPGEDPGEPPSQPPGSEEPAADEGEGCADCSRVVVLEGVQKLALERAGRSEREATFAFRLGAGAFESLDPIGQLYAGAWNARDARGRKLRLHLPPEASGDLERLLAASAEDLGPGVEGFRLAGPARIELRLAAGGAVVGKVVVRFEAEVDGTLRRGSYVAKLRSA